MDVSGNGSCINVDVDDLCMWGKFMKLSGDTVIKTCSDGEKQIAVADCHICCISTMHAKVSDKKRMFCGDSAASHNGCDNRNLSLFNYLR